jgi:cytochrome c peroxidase
MGNRTLRGRRFAGAVVVVASGAAALAGDETLRAPSHPPENAPNEAKRVLGKILFFEEQLSSDSSVACATCHVMARGGTDPRRRSGRSMSGGGAVFASPGVVAMTTDGRYLGTGRQVTPRTAPSPFAASYAPALLWDGAAGEMFVDPVSSQTVIVKGGALENQALRPLLNQAEMSHPDRTMPEVLAKLERVAPLALADRLPPDVQAALDGNPDYPELFRRAFGDPALTAPRVAMAIATYERTLVPDQTDYDRFVAGDDSALTAKEKRGLAAFSTAGCIACHAPPLFSDETFRATGVRPLFDDFAATGPSGGLGCFKVPSLRNVALKRSFFHDGKRTSLHEAILFYKRVAGAARRKTVVEGAGEKGGSQAQDTVAYGDGKPDQVQFVEEQDPAMDDIQLSNQDVDDIQTFLEGGLVDPRVQDGQFPFDGPLLASDHLEFKPDYGDVATNRGTDGGEVMLAGPAMPGSDDFCVGLDGGYRGTQARLVLTSPDPRTPTISDAQFVTGDGSAAVCVPMTDAQPGTVLHLVWRVSTPALGDFSSPAAEIPVIAPRAAAVPNGGVRARPDAPTVDDADPYVSRAGFHVDWKKSGVDAFSAALRVNPTGAGTDVSQAKLSVRIGGAALLSGAQFDADGRLRAGAGDASFDRVTGEVKISLRDVDLREALPGTRDGGRGGLDVPLVVSVDGMGLRAPTVATTIRFSWSGRAGAVASGRFVFARAASAPGVFQITRVVPVQSRLKATGVISTPDGAPFAAPAGLTLRIGDSWRLDVDSSRIRTTRGVIVASAPRDGLRSLRFDARARTFALDVAMSDRPMLMTPDGTLVPMRIRIDARPTSVDPVVSYETFVDVAPR